MTTQEMVEVMQAYTRGEAIEFCDLDRPDIWFDVEDVPQWAWDLNSYRVKPKPSEKLWYWEYQDVDGEWEMTNARYTKSDLSNEVLGPNERETAIPLYALGFRLKDEKCMKKN